MKGTVCNESADLESTDFDHSGRIRGRTGTRARPRRYHHRTRLRMRHSNQRPQCLAASSAHLRNSGKCVRGRPRQRKRDIRQFPADPQKTDQASRRHSDRKRHDGLQRSRQFRTG